MKPCSVGGKSATPRRWLRSFWRLAHLYLGLSAGALFVLAGITGSILVYYVEIDSWLNPEIRAVASDARPSSYEDVFRALQQSAPERIGAWRIEVTESGGAIPVRFYKPSETAGHGFSPLMAWVDPETLEVVRSTFWGDYAMTWIYDLHFRLLLGPAGATIMGIAGMVLLVLMLSGVYLWWPARGKWLSGLTVKARTSPQRRIYDIHKVTGVYGLAVLLVLVLTGVVLSLPGTVRPLLDRMSPLHAPSAVSQWAPGADRIAVDMAVRIAQARFPGAELAWIETPAGPNGTFRINLWQEGEPSRRFPRTNVWIDPSSGHILDVRDGRNDSAGDTLLAWMHPLHSGEAFGTAGRLLILLSGILPVLLFATGLVRWRQKQAGRSTARLKSVASQARPKSHRGPEIRGSAISKKASQPG